MSASLGYVDPEVAAELAALVATLLATLSIVGPVEVVPADDERSVAVRVEYGGESWFLEVAQ